MTRSTWLSLAVAAGLAIALPGAASAAAGCCQYRDSCKKTDDADACTAAGGNHYQLGVCDGKTCQPTASGGPVDSVPIGQQAAVCPAHPMATTAQTQQSQASSAGFNCVTKAGDFCSGL